MKNQNVVVEASSKSASTDPFNRVKTGTKRHGRIGVEHLL
jgi:hypothetical protein